MPYLLPGRIHASKGQFPRYVTTVFMTVAHVYLQDLKNQIL
jgi:hypothetical protein